MTQSKGSRIALLQVHTLRCQRKELEDKGKSMMCGLHRSWQKGMFQNEATVNS